MGNVVLIDDLHDQCSPSDRHQGRVAGGHVDRDGHHLIERRGADAQGVAPWRQDNPLAVRAAADPLPPWKTRASGSSLPVIAGTNRAPMPEGTTVVSAASWSAGVEEVHRYRVCAASGGCWAAVCAAVATAVPQLRRAPATALVRRMCVVLSSSLLIRLLVVPSAGSASTRTISNIRACIAVRITSLLGRCRTVAVGQIASTAFVPQWLLGMFTTPSLDATQFGRVVRLCGLRFGCACDGVPNESGEPRWPWPLSDRCSFRPACAEGGHGHRPCAVCRPPHVVGELVSTGCSCLTPTAKKPACSLLSNRPSPKPARSCCRSP